MSIILKGIDMPEDGGTIVLKIKGSKIYREYPRHKFQPTRIKDAEAIQIPTPHGRIVDLKDIRYCAFSSDGKTREIQFLLDTQVDALPTILEAEE